MKSTLRELVQEADDRVDLYQAPRRAIEEVYKNPCAGSQSCNRSLKVAVVAAPCHGYGDVIFATKIARYIKNGFPHSHPYSRNVTIITPVPEMFKQLGIKDIKIISLTSAGRAQCRRLRNYKRPRGLGVFDLIFVAPLMHDFDISYSDVKGLLKESTPFNTIFLSEYQENPDWDYDFVPGLGEEYDGLLFDSSRPSSKLKTLGTTPYALAYLVSDVGIQSCLSSFVKMIVAKYYKKYPNLQIVMPEWGARKLSHNQNFKTFVKKYYSKLIIKTKSKERVLNSGNSNASTLTLRGDILPVSRSGMLSLMKYSIPDILVTGDQSITDVIDCCQRKNIWYQTVPWKRDLAISLAKELPQHYLASARTSCGTLKAIRWNSKTSNFKSKHDFRKKAKHGFDVIFRAASEARRRGSVIHKYLAQLNKSSSKPALLALLD